MKKVYIFFGEDECADQSALDYLAMLTGYFDQFGN